LSNKYDKILDAYREEDGGGGVSFGTTTQIPYMNAGGTDFIYSGDFTFNGTELYALGGRLGTNLYFDDTSSAVEKIIGVDAQASSNVEGNALSIYSGQGNGSGANGDLRLYLPSQTISDSTTDNVGQSELHLNYIGGVTGLTIANSGNNDVFENANMSLNSAYNTSGNQVRAGNLDINGGDGTLNSLANYIDVYTGQIGINGGLLTIDADYATGGSIEVQGGTYIADDEELTAGSVRILAGTIGGAPSYTTVNGRITLQQADNEFDFSNGGQTGILDFGSLTGGRTFTFPDTTGTIALTSNLPTYGTDNQIPFVNATNNGLEYSADITYTGTSFNVLKNARVGGNTAFIDPYSSWGVQAPAVLQISKGTSTSNSNSNFPALILNHNLTAGGNHIIGTITYQNEAIAGTEKRVAQMFVFTEGGINAGAYAFATANGGAPTEKMRISKGGYVGIGTSSPQTFIHQSMSNTSTLPAVEIEQLSSGDSAIQWSIVGDSWANGIDNSDNDLLKWSYSSTAGTAVLGTNDTMALNASLEVIAYTGFIPDANDGAYLGKAGTAFSDLFLAEGGVINWDSGDVTITQTGNLLAFAGASTAYTFDAPVRLKNYTVGTLPAGTQGDRAYVTDATAPTYLGALTGGGAVVCPVFFNGTAWVSC
jgi:hypothetical protein